MLKNQKIIDYLFIALIFSQIFDIFEIFSLKIYQLITLILIGFLTVNFYLANQKNLFEAVIRKSKLAYENNKLILNSVAVLIVASSLALLNADNLIYSLKQTLVLIFVLLIFLLIYFWLKKSKRNLIIVIKTILVSSVLVSLFSIYQNIAHELGLISFELMAARPNGFFFEPDWLGIYSVIVIGIILPVIVYKAGKLKTVFQKPVMLKLWLVFLLNLITLIISVARASWVAFILILITFFSFSLILYIRKKITVKQLQLSLKILGGVILTLCLAIILIKSLKLTRFNLVDRFESIYQGEHIITVAKKGEEKFKIDLEEIDHYRSLGYEIIEEKIEDVNVQSRVNAYSSNLEMIKEHPVLGQGQGSVIAKRGFIHNANNLFYEWWIGSGIFGLIAFWVLLLNPSRRPLQLLFFKSKTKLSKKARLKDFIFNLFLIFGLINLIIPNLFNSGIFFIPFWILLALINNRL